MLSFCTDDAAQKLHDIVSQVKESLEERDDYMMCEVADRLFNQGKKEGIQGTVNVLRKLGKKDEEILEFIMEVYGLKEEEAKPYL